MGALSNLKREKKPVAKTVEKKCGSKALKIESSDDTNLKMINLNE